MPVLIVIAVVVLLAILYIWSLYNQFVTTKTRIRASIQEIGNQLKRQADLIPNLIASVKGYMKHEKDIFKDLTEARKAVMKVSGATNPQKLLDVSGQMQSALAPIRVVLESTPQLQAVGSASKLMDELRDTADKVMYSRRTLIDLTADYNIKVVTFPSKLVASIFRFKQEPGLAVSEDGDHVKVQDFETKTPKVEL